MKAATVQVRVVWRGPRTAQRSCPEQGSFVETFWGKILGLPWTHDVASHFVWLVSNEVVRLRLMMAPPLSVQKRPY